MVRAFMTALFTAVVACSPFSSASAQTATRSGVSLPALETRLQGRFQVLPLANGVVLTPKFKSTIRSVEVTDRAIAIDGVPVTGAELQEKLGADAELIFQLSYLDSASRRSVLGLGSTAPVAPVVPVAPSAPAVGVVPVPGGDAPQRTRAKLRDNIVKFGGNVVVDEDETVTGDIAAIGGSATINGQVQGDVAVIGGSLSLGPRAEVHGDTTVVGGTLTKAPGALITGEVSEVGMGDAIRARRAQVRAPRSSPGRDYGSNPVIGFTWTLVPVLLIMLLAGIVLLVAPEPVRQIADKAAANPFKAWAIGFLAEILFVPMVVITVIVLAVSIIGIPLLLLIPVALVGLMAVCVVGFTGVAFQIGRLVQERLEQIRDRPFLATAVGICVIAAPLLVARVLGLIWGLGVIAGLLMAAGFVLQYVVWTTGLGAAALVRVERTVVLPPPPVTSLPPDPASIV
jgi:Polymer-forming cytoskeletal